MAQGFPYAESVTICNGLVRFPLMRCVQVNCYAHCCLAALQIKAAGWGRNFFADCLSSQQEAVQRILRFPLDIRQIPALGVGAWQIRKINRIPAIISLDDSGKIDNLAHCNSSMCGQLESRSGKTKHLRVLEIDYIMRRCLGIGILTMHCFDDFILRELAELLDNNIKDILIF